jgi:hypothetical protein
MTTRALAVALALAAALGCKATHSASPPDTARDGSPVSDTSFGADAGPPTDAGHCIMGQSTIGDCAL